MNKVEKVFAYRTRRIRELNILKKYILWAIYEYQNGIQTKFSRFEKLDFLSKICEKIKKVELLYMYIIIF